jgi:hypothetical protein
MVFDLEIQPTQKPGLDLAVARKIHRGLDLMNGPRVSHHP